MLVIKKNLEINNKPLPYNIGFGLTEKYYNILLKRTHETGLNLSELIRIALDMVIFNEDCVEIFKSQTKADDILVHRRTICLEKKQYDRIRYLSGKYKIAMSAIIRKTIEVFCSDNNTKN